MEIHSYFTNIRSHITTEINRASSSIFTAVHCFTDLKLFDILCDKAKQGIDVQLTIVDNLVTRECNINYLDLEKFGGKVHLIDENKAALMHNKFCVIDYKTLITGSYNWKGAEENNFDNVIINNDNLIAEQFSVLFIKLIDESNHNDSTRKLVLDIFGRNPALFIDLISQYYPLNEAFIERFEILNWKYLSSNESLRLSTELIEKYEDKWKWSGLSKKNSLPWSIQLIENYKDKWDWSYLSGNKSLPWSIELIENFKDKWNWSILTFNESMLWSDELISKYIGRWNWDALSKNKSLILSVELIEKHRHTLLKHEDFPMPVGLVEKYKDDWNWLLNLSTLRVLPLSVELIEKYKYNWNWYGLSLNESLPWSFELIEKYRDSWDWWKLSENKFLPWSLELIDKYEDRWSWYDLSGNEALPWSVDLIEKYKNKWKWCYEEGTRGNGGLSANKSITWSIELIEKYKNNWNWHELSSIETLPWSIEFIEKFNNHLNFKYLSSVKSLPWSTVLIEKYKDQIIKVSNNHERGTDWDWSQLALNSELPWSIELIEKYEDKWEYIDYNAWGDLNQVNNWSFLSRNESIPWSHELIKKYEDKWDWNELLENKSLPWSLKLLYKYTERIIGTKLVWKVMNPYIHDELIEQVFEMRKQNEK